MWAGASCYAEPEAWGCEPCLLDSWPYREDLFLEAGVACEQTRKGGPLAGLPGAALHFLFSGHTGQHLAFPLEWPWA